MKILSFIRLIFIIQDWGAATTKIVLALDEVIPSNAIDVDTFKVEVARSDNRLTSPFIESGERKVTNIYVSNKNGKGTVMGKYVTLEMEIGPEVTLGSPLNYYDSRNEWIDCNYTITQVKDIQTPARIISGIVATENTGKDNLVYTRFANVVDTSGLYTNADGTPYEYNGHWSWIYVFNNEVYAEVNGQTVSIMEWLASKNLNAR